MPANVALLLAALAMPATLTGTPRQRSSTEVLPIESHGGFRFEKGDCDRDPGFCERRQPKAWTSDEITIVKQAIDEILTRPLGPEALGSVGTACCYDPNGNIVEMIELEPGVRHSRANEALAKTS